MGKVTAPTVMEPAEKAGWEMMALNCADVSVVTAREMVHTV